MDFGEIVSHLAAKGITVTAFCEEYFDKFETPEDYYASHSKLPWLGLVKLVNQKVKERSGGRPNKQILVYHLPAHGVYLKTKAVVENAPEPGEEGWEEWQREHPGCDWRWRYVDEFLPVEVVVKYRVVNYHKLKTAEVC